MKRMLLAAAALVLVAGAAHGEPQDGSGHPHWNGGGGDHHRGDNSGDGGGGRRERGQPEGRAQHAPPQPAETARVQPAPNPPAAYVQGGRGGWRGNGQAVVQSQDAGRQESGRQAYRGRTWNNGAQVAESGRHGGGDPRWNNGDHGQWNGGQNNGQWNGGQNNGQWNGGRVEGQRNSGNDGRWRNDGDHRSNGRDWNGNRDGRSWNDGRWNNDRRDHDLRSRDRGRAWFDPGRYRQSYHATHRYHVGSYRYPRGWHYQRWTFGDFLPFGWFTSNYYIDAWDYGLPQPPIGCEWVRQGSDAVLVDVWTGEILSVYYDLFW